MLTSKPLSIRRGRRICYDSPAFLTYEAITPWGSRITDGSTLRDGTPRCLVCAAPRKGNEENTLFAEKIADLQHRQGSLFAVYGSKAQLDVSLPRCAFCTTHAQRRTCSRKCSCKCGEPLHPTEVRGSLCGWLAVTHQEPLDRTSAAAASDGLDRRTAACDGVHAARSPGSSQPDAPPSAHAAKASPFF